MEKYTFASIIGPITLFYDEDLIKQVLVGFESLSKHKPDSRILELQTQFNQFLTGKREKLDLPISIEGSAFTIDVLNEILTIPIGKTVSYKEVAIRSGYPKAYRAVGSICKKNKLPIIIPCHRVIKSSGEIGEYAFGKQVKKQLLDLEKSFRFD